MIFFQKYRTTCQPFFFNLHTKSCLLIGLTDKLGLKRNPKNLMSRRFKVSYIHSVPPRPRAGLPLCATCSLSFCLTKQRKRPGGSAATLIKPIRQLAAEYLQSTLGLSLDLAQEINNSPDRYNPRQIGAREWKACRWGESVSGVFTQLT